MPVGVVKRGKKFRIVEESTGRIAMSPKGNPLDGGGHEDKSKAGRQMGYINAGLERKKK